MDWGLVAGAAASLLSGALSSRAAGRAAQAQARAAEAATAETARQFDLSRADLAPWRTTGAGALNQLARLFGLPSTTPEAFTAQQDVLVGDTMLPAGTTTRHVGNGWYEVHFGGRRIGTLRPGGPNGRFINDTGADINALRAQQAQQIQASQTPAGPDMSVFMESPGYQFRRSEGMRGIERTAAARGGAFSGNALRALTEFNSNLASNEFGNFFNQLAGIAGVGQAATNTTAALGADAAANASRNALLAGDARASGIIGRSNAIGNTLQDLAGLYGYYSNRPQLQEIPMFSLPRRI
ncbi:MAG TPA: hypothetical protein VF193_07515 [Steroidobacter sp.]